MRFASGISDAVNAHVAVEQACQHVLDQLGGTECHFVSVFASAIYRSPWPDILTRIHRRLNPKILIGCSASGIIGGVQELEWVPAISIVAANLPTVKLHPFFVSPEEMEHAVAGGFWIDKIGVAPDAQPVFILYIDPYTCRPEQLLADLNGTYPQRPIVGGLVSGGNEPGSHFLFMDHTIRHDGAVGVAMSGDITMDTLISQGCRPVGRPYIITEAEENIVWRLGGRPALEVLHEVLSSLPSDDRELAQEGSVLVGLVINEMRPQYLSGDFLIRQIVGLDPNAGALALADDVETGQTLQFHLRDAATARQELRRLLVQQQQAGQHVAGALLFNCLGRGKSFYGTSHHDIKTIRTFSGKVPVGGFFCNGEIGPVGGRNLLHGYTASVGFFRPLTTTSHAAPEARDASSGVA